MIGRFWGPVPLSRFRKRKILVKRICEAVLEIMLNKKIMLEISLKIMAEKGPTSHESHNSPGGFDVPQN